MTFGSLFSGIGGIDLGLERAGMICKWQVEKNPYCLKVLAKHWPDVPKFVDVRGVGKHNLEPVDLICGGFPCQDVSNAGKRAGIKGERSGLWSEFHRIICELRPPFALIENVPGLFVRGMDKVLCDLAESGHDAEWQVISAEAAGAPHLRERVFVVAYPQGIRREWSGTTPFAFPSAQIGQNVFRRYRATVGRTQWETEPGMGRMVNGVPDWMDRIRNLGNSVVPQVAEFIGLQLMEALRNQRTRKSCKQLTPEGVSFCRSL